jgi:hypothetical protein
MRMVLGITLTMLLATATYRLVEVPARAWIRKLVARHLLNRFGPRENNMLPEGQIFSVRNQMSAATSFAVMLVALLVYQFIVVPHFTPYTR